MNRRFLVLVAACAALFTISATPADARHNRVGTLSCNIAPNVSFIVGSMRRAHCVFTPERGRAHRYLAHISRVGLDLNLSGGGVLVWAVFAENRRLYRGDIRGRYTGASGSITLGLGIGGNVLVGGSRNTVALQPLSGEGNVGVGLAVGVAELNLH